MDPRAVTEKDVITHLCISCHNNHPQKKCPELVSPKKMTESKNGQAPRNRTTK